MPNGNGKPRKTDSAPIANVHEEDPRSKATQDIEELAGIAKESQAQSLPEQKVVFKAESIKSRAGRRAVHNLPDATNPPMGCDPDKAFDGVFPFLKLPYLQPNTPEDVISLGSPVACRVQHNLAGEAIKTKEFEISG